ncbi:MAG: ATPase, partial [Pseudonocardiaceae bacterium]
TVVHVVTLLEDLPVQETLDAVADVTAADLRPGAVIRNRVRPSRLATRSMNAAAAGRVDEARIRTGLAEAGLDLKPDVIDGLVAETVAHATRAQVQAAALRRLEDAGLPSVELPELTGGVDLGGLYELVESLTAQGVR